MKTLGDLLADYLEHGRSLNLSSYTLRIASYQVRSFLDWLETRYAVGMADQLRREHFETWLKHLAGRRTGRGLPLKPSTVNKLIESVRGFLKYLRSHGLVAVSLRNGLVYVKEPQLLPTSVLKHEQVRRVLQRVPTTNAEGWRNRAIIELLYSTGLRAGELLGLNVTDVDLAGATAIVLGKGGKQRVVPIGKTALRQLESYIKAVRPFLLRDAAELALFLDRRGQRLPYHTLRRIIHRQAEVSGVEVKVTPHTFRRSCTTELIRGGANLYHVKELLGHESLETLKHYTKLTIEDLRKTHQKCHPRERGESG
jgi:site-specific recombinase XerD